MTYELSGEVPMKLWGDSDHVVCKQKSNCVERVLC